MFDALTYQEMLKEIKKNSEKYGITDDVVAILITRPDLATGKDILNSLEYYHFRTGHSINFYLPGYGAYWTEEEYPDGKVVTEIAGVKWSFSNQRFVEFIEDMEKYSKWRYSGESDLWSILSKEFTINCLISFVYTQGAEKLLETSLCQMEDEFMLEILSKIPFSLQLLDVINQVLDDDTWD